MGFREDKIKRTEKYIKNLGLKTRPCSACSGSGYYDHNGSPKCRACDGTGKEKHTREIQRG